MKNKTITLKIILSLHVISIALAAPFIFATVARAIDDPDSNPSVSNISINRNLRSDGDVLIYGDYSIPYADIPAVLATDAYLFQLRDEDGNIVGTISPYSFMDNGYNEGGFSFYFSPSDNFTWGETYSIRICQNPAIFASPESWEYVIPYSAYTALEDQATNRIDMTTKIINMAQRLESYHTYYSFLESSASGTVLSSPTGETYFRGVIYGIQSMAPDLFLVQILDYEKEDREWTTEQFDEYDERFEGTWVGDAVNTTSNQFGQSKQFVMGLIAVLPLSLGCVIVSSMKFHKTEPGFVAVSVLLIMFGLMSWIHPALLASTYQVMGIYIGYLWFYSRG